jgi:hypothetical protein
MKRLYRLLVILLSSSLLLIAQTPAPQATLLKAARVLDVKAGKYMGGHAVLVRGGNIEAVGPFADLKLQAPTALRSLRRRPARTVTERAELCHVCNSIFHGSKQPILKKV